MWVALYAKGTYSIGGQWKLGQAYASTKSCQDLLYSHTQYSETASGYLMIIGPHQANLVLTAYASSEGSGEPAHSRSLARTSAARSYKQWV